MTEAESWGLVGMGKSGPWQVDLDKATTGRNAWQVTLDGPFLYVRIEVAGPSVAAGIVEFFDKTADKRELSEFVAGKCLDHPVVIVKDDEFPDRWFVSIRGTKTMCAFTLDGTNVEHLQDALRQIVADLAG